VFSFSGAARPGNSPAADHGNNKQQNPKKRIKTQETPMGTAARPQATTTQQVQGNRAPQQFTGRNLGSSEKNSKTQALQAPTNKTNPADQ
jgi:hypothetical protein